MITCPTTRKPVFTGMDFDRRALEISTSIVSNNAIGYPHCGKRHTWSKQDAYFVGD